MLKKTCCQGLITAVFVALMVLVIQGSGRTGEPLSDPQDVRHDIITIDLPAANDGDRMLAVVFQHDRHTRLVKNNNCSACHLKDNGDIVFKFNRIQDGTTESDMAIYHDNCIGCHVEHNTRDADTGPLEGECRACHDARPGVVSGRVPMDFNRSLHYRHETATAIDPAGGKEDTNCGACHHQYNEKTREIFYQKGEESACVYCHKAEKTDTARSIQSASHDSCVACHLTFKTTYLDKKSGPLECGGCHDKQRTAGIKTIENPPRLKRNQPDMSVIARQDLSGLPAEKVSEILAGSMPPVPFDHQAHETASADCKSCHHGSLKSCTECHTLSGDLEKGQGVTLSDAMHRQNTDRSCLGCHDTVKTAPECAGCHAQIPEKPFSDKNCNSCHITGSRNPMLGQMDRVAVAGFAQSLMSRVKDTFKKVPADQIPETVTIGSLSREYEPSKLPHARIIKAIEAGIKDSDLAAWFHGDQTTLCQGCHHNSPTGEKVQSCRSCHPAERSISGTGTDLKSAYHGQCITCHEKMNMDKIAATDCTKCHGKKQ